MKNLKGYYFIYVSVEKILSHTTQTIKNQLKFSLDDRNIQNERKQKMATKRKSMGTILNDILPQES